MEIASTPSAGFVPALAKYRVNVITLAPDYFTSNAKRAKRVTRIYDSMVELLFIPGRKRLRNELDDALLEYLRQSQELLFVSDMTQRTYRPIVGFGYLVSAASKGSYTTTGKINGPVRGPTGAELIARANEILADGSVQDVDFDVKALWALVYETPNRRPYNQQRAPFFTAPLQDQARYLVYYLNFQKQQGVIAIGAPGGFLQYNPLPPMYEPAPMRYATEFNKQSRGDFDFRGEDIRFTKTELEEMARREAATLVLEKYTPTSDPVVPYASSSSSSSSSSAGYLSSSEKADFEKRIDQLNTALKQLQKKKKTVDPKPKKAPSTKSDRELELEQELVAKDIDMLELRGRLDAWKQAYDRMKEDKDAVDAALAASGSATATAPLLQQIADRGTELIAKDTELAGLRTDVAALTVRLEEAEEAKAAAEARVVVVQGEKGQLEADKDGLRLENEQLDTRAGELDTQVGNLTSELAAVESTRNTMKASLDTLKTEKAEHERRIQELENQNAVLANRVTELNTEKQALEAVRDNLTDKLANLKKKVSAKSHAAGDVTNPLEEATEAIAPVVEPPPVPEPEAPVTSSTSSTSGEVGPPSVVELEPSFVRSTIDRTALVEIKDLNPIFEKCFGREGWFTLTKNKRFKVDPFRLSLSGDTESEERFVVYMPTEQDLKPAEKFPAASKSTIYRTFGKPVFVDPSYYIQGNKQALATKGLGDAIAEVAIEDATYRISSSGITQAPTLATTKIMRAKFEDDQPPFVYVQLYRNSPDNRAVVKEARKIFLKMLNVFDETNPESILNYARVADDEL